MKEEILNGVTEELMVPEFIKIALQVNVVSL
jgi:hypothetical protein